MTRLKTRITHTRARAHTHTHTHTHTHIMAYESPVYKQNARNRESEALELEGI